MSTPKRRRLEIPAALWDDIARDAAAIHLPVNAYAISLLARQLAYDRRIELIARHDLPAGRPRARSTTAGSSGVPHA